MAETDPWIVIEDDEAPHGDVRLPTAPPRLQDDWTERRTGLTVAAAVLWFIVVALQVAWLVFGGTNKLVDPVQGDYPLQITDKAGACLGFVLTGVLLLRTRTRTLGLGLSALIGLSWPVQAPGDFRPVEWNETYHLNNLFSAALIAGMVAGALSAAELVRRRRAEGPATALPARAVRARLRQLGVAAGVVSIGCVVGANFTDLRVDTVTNSVVLHCCSYSMEGAVNRAGILTTCASFAFFAVFAVVVRSRALAVAAFLAPALDSARLVVDNFSRFAWPVPSLYGWHGAQLVDDLGRQSVVGSSPGPGFWFLLVQVTVLAAAIYARYRVGGRVSPARVSAAAA